MLRVVVLVFALISLSSSFTLPDNQNFLAQINSYPTYYTNEINSSPDNFERYKRQNIEIGAENRRLGEKDLGTDVNVKVGGRLWETQDGRGTLDAYGNWGRHYGGPSGTSHPNYGAGATFSYRF